MLILASLLLGAGLGLWTLRPGAPQSARAVLAEARRNGQIEHQVSTVLTPDGREAFIHSWHHPTSNALEVVFEPQGDRVLVRTRPR